MFGISNSNITVHFNWPSIWFDQIKKILAIALSQPKLGPIFCVIILEIFIYLIEFDGKGQMQKIDNQSIFKSTFHPFDIRQINYLFDLSIFKGFMSIGLCVHFKYSQWMHNNKKNETTLNRTEMSNRCDWIPLQFVLMGRYAWCFESTSRTCTPHHSP